MGKLLEKLNYKGQKRIALLNAEKQIAAGLASKLEGIIIDSEIDPRCPYTFILVFVRSIAETDHIVPDVIHNLAADGILWFCYPKKTSRNYRSDITRDTGWDALNNSGFYGVRMVSVDENWSAIRFRNIKYIKSESNRFTKSA